MKKFIKILGILALSGLVIGGVIVGVSMFAANKFFKFDEQPSKGEMRELFSSDIQFLETQILSTNDWDSEKLSDSFLVAAGKDAQGNWEAIFPKKEFSKSGHIIINGAGTGKIKYDGTNYNALIYSLDSEDQEFWFFFKDTRDQ